MKKQLLRFLIVGGLSTIINYALFYSLYHFAGLHYIVSSALGFISGVLASFPLNRTWTFNDNTKNKSLIYKYFAVYTSSLILSLLLLNFLVEILLIHPLISNFFAISLTTCTNFLGTKFLVFKTPQGSCL